MTELQIEDWRRDKERMKLTVDDEFLDSKPVLKPDFSLWETED